MTREPGPDDELAALERRLRELREVASALEAELARRSPATTRLALGHRTGSARVTSLAGSPVVGVTDAASGSGVWARSLSLIRPGTTAALVARSEAGPAVQLDLVDAGPPIDGAWATGSMQADRRGGLWWCVEGGRPGRWTDLATSRINVRASSSRNLYAPLAPARVYDSRGAGPSGRFAAGQSRSLSVANRIDPVTLTVDLVDVVPRGATAITANLTVVETSGAGFLAVNPGGDSGVHAAAINWFADDQTLNNGTTLTLGANRSLTVVAGGAPGSSTHAVIDVTGYYTEASTTPDPGPTTTVPAPSTTAPGPSTTSGPTTTTTTTPLPGSIVAADHQWTFVPFSDAFAMGGDTIGIGINPSSTSDQVLIFMDGGGVCSSYDSCWVHVGSTQGPFDAATLADLPLDAWWIFDRASPSNPFRDWNMVFVPYDTGDLHTGTNVAPYGPAGSTHHVGRSNVAAYLKRLVPTFHGASRVVLAGSSAGGYGAVFNLAQVQAAFGSTPVHVLDDSGPILPSASVPADDTDRLFGPQARASWGFDAQLPASCTSCSTDLASIWTDLATTYPGSRIALLSYANDNDIPTAYGISDPAFATALGDLIGARFTRSNLRAFRAAGAGHMMLASPPAGASFTALATFIQQFLAGDPAWANTGPS